MSRTITDDALFSDVFIYAVKSEDLSVQVTLTSTGITVCDGGTLHAYRIKHVHLSDVVGVTIQSDVNKSGVSGVSDATQLVIHYFPLLKRKGQLKGGVERHRKQLVLTAHQHHTTDANRDQCTKWKMRILLAIHGPERPLDPNSGPKQKTYLVFVNPKGGKGDAMKIWFNTVKPILELADITTSVVYTEYNGHARHIVANSTEIHSYSSILTISGDGIVFEVINGMMDRGDWDEAVKIPLTIIPGGSGNGLCAAILTQSGIPLTLLDAVFVAVRGVPCPMDLVRVEQGDTVIWSFLSVCWGLLSAIDIESESMRWLGEARFTVQAIKQLINYRDTFHQSGRMWFAPLSENQRSVKQRLSNGAHHNIECIIEQSGNADLVSDDLANDIEVHNLIPALSVPSDTDSLSQDGCQCVKCCPKLDTHTVVPLVESLNENIPESWQVIEGDFATIMAFSSTHLTFGYQTTGDLRLDSGFIYVMFTRDPPVTDFLQLLTQNCKPECNESSTVRFEKVTAFRFEPDLTETRAYITVDGELMPYESLHACIKPGIARVLCLPSTK